MEDKIMNPTPNYKEVHESFIMNHNGTSLWENFLIITPVPILVYFVCLIKYIFGDLYKGKHSKDFKQWLGIEFVALFLSTLLSLTIFSDHLLMYAMVIIAAYAGLIVQCKNRINKWVVLFPQQKSGRRPYIAYFRTIISIMTSICILAVDFHIFPRRFAKTESYGFGLMDTGVGFYIVINGILSRFKTLDEVFSKSLISSIPLFLVGCVRYFVLQCFEYQTHVSEYGVHWNFFFTLAFVKIFASLLIIIYPDNILSMTVSIAIMHQIILFIVAENWVLSDSPRTSFISANKEGLISLPGYIVLYLSGVVIGRFLKITDNLNLIQDFHHGLTSIKLAPVFLVITIISYFLFDVSRRLANLTYITWIICMSLYGLGLSIFVELSLRISLHLTDTNYERLTPDSFRAVNQHSLYYFILSNIFTGIINCVFPTFYCGSFLSICILVGYQACLFFIVCGTYYVNLNQNKLFYG